MKVIFDGATAQEHPGTGVLLVPGENEIPDDRAGRLLELGLVRVVPAPAPPPEVAAAASTETTTVDPPKRAAKKTEA